MTITTLPTVTVPSAPTSPVSTSNWQADAACRGLDTDSFFLPDAVRGKTKRNMEAAAKAVCSACPVAAMCLQQALLNEEAYGVWGGKTPEERELLLDGRYTIAA